MSDKIYLNKEGYDNYLKELDLIKEKIRKNSMDMTEFASDDAYGDGWHDNFAYESSLQKENALFFEYKRKLDGLNKIVIVEHSNSGLVDIGSVVTIFIDGEEEPETYKITGNTTLIDDGNMLHITINSPLGRCLYKKKKNDTFEYEVNSVKITGKIMDIY